MPVAHDTPADTTMMRIVHDAFRRDLARARTVLAASSATGDQRRAVGAHLEWMMRFLDAHHRIEETGLYPLARGRIDRPGELAVLDRMYDEHAAIATAGDELAGFARHLSNEGTDDAARCALGAVDALSAVLLPHLRDEEVDAMPIVARVITPTEWQAIEHEQGVDGKSKSQLGFEAHWLIDEASDEDRAAVLALVSPIVRFVLLYGYGPRYRRHAAERWGQGQPKRPPRRVQLECCVSVTVDADIDDVWSVVSDVTRVGEWSHECVEVEWVGGAQAPAPGARFRGRNHAGVLRWSRVSEIVSAEPYELIWVTVPTTFYPDSSEWRITLDRSDHGTTITQRFRVVRAPKALSVIYATINPAHRDRTDALTRDLERLGAVAKRATAAHSTVTLPRHVDAG